MAIDRPLKLGELLAETVRLYGERLWAMAGIGALLAGAIVNFGLSGVLFVLSLYFQETRGYSPSATGLAFRTASANSRTARALCSRS